MHAHVEAGAQRRLLRLLQISCSWLPPCFYLLTQPLQLFDFLLELCMKGQAGSKWFSTAAHSWQTSVLTSPSSFSRWLLLSHSWT